MNRLTTALLALASIAIAALPATAETSRFSLELEAGPVWQSSNDVQIPNDEFGTRFSLEELVGKGPWPAGRLYFTWNINQKHGLRLLLAPLSYTETGIFDDAVLFAGEAYEAGIPTEATYQFNSWRLSYRYKFKNGERWQLVDRRHRQDPRRQDRAPPGRHHEPGHRPRFRAAPVLRRRLALRREAGTSSLDLDGLAGGPGRAVDLALKIGYDINERWSVTAGYRTVEGGADVDEVYNFAWFNSAVVSGVVRF